MPPGYDMPLAGSQTAEARNVEEMARDGRLILIGYINVDTLQTPPSTLEELRAIGRAHGAFVCAMTQTAGYDMRAGS